MCTNSTFNNLATLLLVSSGILLATSYVCPYIIYRPPAISISSIPRTDHYKAALASGSLLLPPKGMRARLGGTTEGLGVLAVGVYFGFLGECEEETTCSWFYQNDFAWQTGKPSWHKVCQALFGAGFVLCLVAAFIQIGYLCCKCRNNLNIVITLTVAVFIGVATILCGVSIGIYSGSSLTDGILTPLSVSGVGGTLAWAFYLGIAGVAIGGAAALMFFVDVCYQVRKYGSYDTSPEKSELQL